MKRDSLSKFGRFVIENYWDRAIASHDLLAKGHWKAPALQKLQRDVAALDKRHKALVRRCVVEALITGLHDFLFAFQEAHDLNKGIEILVDGDNVAEISDGLHGEIFCEDGWIARFGKYPEPSGNR